jgi:hypothetical protein
MDRPETSGSENQIIKKAQGGATASITKPSMVEGVLDPMRNHRARGSNPLQNLFDLDQHLYTGYRWCWVYSS